MDVDDLMDCAQVGDVLTVGGAATGKQLAVESITDSPQI